MEGPKRRGRRKLNMDEEETPRARRVNPSSSEDESEDHLNVEKQKRYQLRNLPRKGFTAEDDDDTTNDDFSPDTSEYIPSPNRKIQSHSSSPLSSLGGDSDYIVAVMNEKKLNTPSTISNLSYCLNQMDFIASPEVVYIAKQCSTPVQDKNSKFPEMVKTDFYVDITLKATQNDTSAFELSCRNSDTTLLTVEVEVEEISPSVLLPSTLPALQHAESPSSALQHAESPSSALQPSESASSALQHDESPSSALQHAESASSALQHAESSSSALQHAESPSSALQHAESASSALQHAESSSSALQPSESASSALQHAESSSSALQHTESPSSALQHAESASSALQHTESPSSALQPSESASSALQHDESPSSALQHAESASSALQHAESSSSALQPSESASSALQHAESSSSALQHAESPSSALQHAESASSALQHAESPSSALQPSESASSALQHDESPSSALQHAESPSSALQHAESPSSALQHAESPSSALQHAKSPSSALQHAESPSSALQPSESASSALQPGEPRTSTEPHLTAETSSSATQPPKEMTRKRKHDKENWACNLNKKRKNSGQAYKGCHSKKTYPAKTVRSSCSCKKACSERIPPHQRIEIFDKFYELGDRTYQWQFIFKHIETKDIKCMTLNRKCNRTQTINYFFYVNNEKVQVCKKFFLNTLSISDSMIYTALEKNETEHCMIDHRGQHDNRPHKIKPATQETVIDHIKLFPTVEAHYVRKDSNKLYLSQDLNINKMYRLYQTWFANQNYHSELMATERQYRTIFNTKFNLSFFKPKKDLCPLCTRYDHADSDEKNLLDEKYKKHIKNKNDVRDIKNNEKENADELKTIAIFDLQKVLYVPKSEVGVFYYKRKYPIYNFTVFDASRKMGYCFMWHHQIAKRGAVEIGSCLIKFLENEQKRGIKTVSFYSDGCRGQNKNRFIFALYVYLSIKFGMNITHRFFETGHSQNEGDSMHACIERELKSKKVLYTPDQMYSVAMNAKIKGEKYIVKEMEQSEFVNTKQLVENKNWINDTNGAKIAWSKVMEVNASCDHPNKLFFKYDVNEDYKELNTVQTNNRQRRGGRRGRGGLTSQSSVSPCVTETAIPNLPRAYHEPIPISKALHSDLMSLCKTNDIPQHYHAFYKSLTCEGDLVVTYQSDEDNASYSD